MQDYTFISEILPHREIQGSFYLSSFHFFGGGHLFLFGLTNICVESLLVGTIFGWGAFLLCLLFMSGLGNHFCWRILLMREDIWWWNNLRKKTSSGEHTFFGGKYLFLDWWIHFFGQDNFVFLDEDTFYVWTLIVGNILVMTNSLVRICFVPFGMAGS